MIARQVWHKYRNVTGRLIATYTNHKGVEIGIINTGEPAYELEHYPLSDLTQSELLAFFTRTVIEHTAPGDRKKNLVDISDVESQNQIKPGE